MIELQNITIDKKEELNAYIKQSRIENSEFTFTNLFMWRRSYDILYCELCGLLCLFPKHGSGTRSATFPIGDIANTEKVKFAVERIIEYFEKTNRTLMLRLYGESQAELLDALFPGKFILTANVNSFDYVYSVEELINLSGRKFHQKRNHVNKFKSLYGFEYRRITGENLSDCETLYDKWHSEKADKTEVPLNGISVSDVAESREAFFELTANFDKLDVTGGGIYVNGKLAAFSFGEPLSENTAVIHFECGDVEYNGAFPMINQQFLEHEWAGYEFVNREEDMGIEGLRQAKKSYHPVKMVEKYVATLG